MRQSVSDIIPSMNTPPSLTPAWPSALRYNPLPALLAAPNPATGYFARRDLPGEDTPPVKTLWEQPGERGAPVVRASFDRPAVNKKLSGSSCYKNRSNPG